MRDDTTADRESSTADDRDRRDDPTDSFDLEHSDRVRIGVTRGEKDAEIGPPREYPDRADVAVRPADDGGRIVVSIDAMAGDHARGHADLELTPTEARALGNQLDETVRWMTGTDEKGTGDGIGSGD
ncbi:hypothetical protein [Halopiger goleimassiliensis]|uniref:hypothetical protein n=1 Tax=Halopiger goleimassiliensis TaxID=1293048 RepID=UPI000677CE91|nr:hypothetical protein [Halopiger goleimassiliensis]